jgi:predicted transcriptional regulator
MRTQKSWRNRKLPSGQLVALFNAMKKDVLEYLAEYSQGRHAKIAAEVGLTRETIGRYITGAYNPTDIYTIQELHNWMVKDRKNGHG